MTFDNITASQKESLKMLSSGLKKKKTPQKLVEFLITFQSFRNLDPLPHIANALDNYLVDSENVNKNKKDLFEEAALKKGYSLDKDGGKYADAWLEEAWQVHKLVE